MSLPRFVPLVAMAIAVLVAGMLVGRMLRSQRDAGHVHEVTPPAFVIGDAIPDVKLTTEWGDSTTTQALLAGQDGVVLFLDPECPPCVGMARTWGNAIDAGKVDANRVFAVVTQTGPVVAKFNAETAPSLRIYMDREKAFERKHGVVEYPLVVAVAPTGQVRFVGSDPATDPATVVGK